MTKLENIVDAGDNKEEITLDLMMLGNYTDCEHNVAQCTNVVMFHLVKIGISRTHYQ